jgi:hypothetical protein
MKREAPTGALEEPSWLVVGGGVDFLAVLQSVEAEECGRHHSILTQE